jgi:gas vesicle protein
MAEERNYGAESLNGGTDPNRGGFVALAVIAAALGAGAAILLAPEEGARTRRRFSRGIKSIGDEAAGTLAQLQRDIRRRRNQSRREKRVMALAGLLVGAGIAALVTPESGSEARRRLGGTISRIKVGAVDRIDRLRQRDNPAESGDTEPRQVRSVQELGRDPNSVF